MGNIKTIDLTKKNTFWSASINGRLYLRVLVPSGMYFHEKDKSTIILLKIHRYFEDNLLYVDDFYGEIVYVDWLNSKHFVTVREVQKKSMQQFEESCE